MNWIGPVRRFLFVPWPSRWNAWVRDITAAVELKIAAWRALKDE